MTLPAIIAISSALYLVIIYAGIVYTPPNDFLDKRAWPNWFSLFIGISTIIASSACAVATFVLVFA